MRATKINLDYNPREQFGKDDRRGIFIFRNTHPTDTAYVQFGVPSNRDDGFPVLAGDTLTLDRGDLSQAIFIWTSTITGNSTNNCLVG